MTSCLTTHTNLWSEGLARHYEANSSRLKKRLYFSCGDGAEDVVHDAYERALRYSNSYDGDHFDKWFGTIIRNAIRDYKKAERGQSESDEIDEYDHIGATCVGVTNKVWEELFTLIDKKSPDHAEVLNLYFNLGYSYKDIASVTSNTYFNTYRIITRFKEELVKRYGS